MCVYIDKYKGTSSSIIDGMHRDMEPPIRDQSEIIVIQLPIKSNFIKLPTQQ